MSTWVKICGVTSVVDAELVVSAGADALGLNFVTSSPRAVALETARRIRDAVAGRIEVVLIVADLGDAELEALQRELEPDWLQLHGSESPALLTRLLPRAYKAIHVREAADVDQAERFGGERILVDAKVPGQLGGTGESFDYRLVRGLSQARQLILAGGLTPNSVSRAVADVRPFGVDVASGVEPKARPGHKQPELVRAFVSAAKST